MAAKEDTMTEEEFSELKETFTKMGARPKTDTKVDLEQWIQMYAAGLQHQAAPKATENNKPESSQSTTLIPTAIMVTGRKPWLAKFTGERGNEGYDLWRHQVMKLEA